MALSNRADLLSSGDVLVEVVLPSGANARELSVRLNGQAVTGFAARAQLAGRVLGVITGLRSGPSTLTASLPDGRGARLQLTNHARGGPVFAGPQVHPWVCQTVEAGLGPAQDQACNAPTQVEWFYKSTNPTRSGLQPYDPTAPPSDVATTTTDQGRTVPFVVRRETGTVDRGIYRTALLHTPGSPVVPWEPQPGWNRKLYYLFDGGAQPGHQQGTVLREVLDERALGRGFALATSTLNANAQNTNSVVAAEALMMVKELFVEQFGPIRYTLSSGPSGGSMQQHVTANAYPGLLDGIVPDMSFPDLITTVAELSDCALLNRHYTQDAPLLWAVEPQQAAVNGHQSSSVCHAWDTLFNLDATLLDPRVGCLGPTINPLPSLPEAPWVYDPVSNPRGERCTLQDYLVAVLGRRPAPAWSPIEKRIGRGFANRPYDNVGVQYGLTALRAGRLLPEQFVTLNERIGGYDLDGLWQPQRTAGDPQALRSVYRTGLLNDFAHVDIPVLDVRAPLNVEIHTDYHSYVTRARLEKAHGDSTNHVVWVNGDPLAAFDVMDRWLTALEADTSERPLRQRVAAARPAIAVSSCFVGSTQIVDAARCRALYPTFASPRLAAGAPLTEDVQKCQLAPLVRADYPATLTDAQWQRLRQTFPTGVCDYRRPSVGAERSRTWLTYADAHGGAPLTLPPVSMPFRGPSSVSAPTDSGPSLRDTLPATGGSPTLALIAALCAAGAAVSQHIRRSSQAPPAHVPDGTDSVRLPPEAHPSLPTPDR